MTRVEQIQAEYEYKMSVESARETAKRFEAQIAQFIAGLGAVGVEQLRLVEALNSVALKVQLAAEREGFRK